MNLKKLFIGVSCITLCMGMIGCGKIENNYSSTTEKPSVNSTSNNTDESNNSSSKEPSASATSTQKEEKLDLTKIDKLILGNGTREITGGGTCLSEGSILYLADKTKLTYQDRNKISAIQEEYANCDPGSEPEEMYERINAEAKTIIEANCNNLNLYKNNLIFTKDDGKVYTCDKTGQNLTQLKELDTYKVDMMYVLQDKYLLFSSKGNVYQYNCDTKAIIDYNKSNVDKFMPTTYGMIYTYKTDDSATIYAEEESKIAKAAYDKSLFIYEDYLVFTSKDDGNLYMLPLELFFTNFSEKDFELFDFDKFEN